MEDSESRCSCRQLVLLIHLYSYHLLPLLPSAFLVFILSFPHPNPLLKPFSSSATQALTCLYCFAINLPLYTSQPNLPFTLHGSHVYNPYQRLLRITNVFPKCT